ncbi:MAG: hypothetical protein ACE5EL_04845 [Anaerolineae bacterium]
MRPAAKGRRRRTFGPLVVGGAIVALLAACQHDSEWQAPAGFSPAGLTDVTPAEIVELAAESPLVQPTRSETRYYTRQDAPGGVVTATLAVFARAAGAQAAYNGWYARFGFLPAVERFPIDAGQQAERLELGWPPLHAAIAWGGLRFVVVKGDTSLPEEVRTAAMENLIRGLLAP